MAKLIHWFTIHCSKFKIYFLLLLFSSLLALVLQLKPSLSITTVNAHDIVMRSIHLLLLAINDKYTFLLKGILCHKFLQTSCRHTCSIASSEWHHVRSSYLATSRAEIRPIQLTEKGCLVPVSWINVPLRIMWPNTLYLVNDFSP